MQKKNKGGKKFKKNKKYGNEKTTLILKQDDCESYAKVIKMLGSGRLTCKLPDGREILGIIPGRMKKRKQWIRLNDIILVSIRDFQDNKADVLCVYNYSEVEMLKNQSLIPKIFDDCQLINNNYDLGMVEFTNEEPQNDINNIESSEPLVDKKRLLENVKVFGDNNDDSGSDIDIDDI